MVEITDFEGNSIPNPNKTKKTDKINLTYHIEPKIRHKWDTLRDGRLQYKLYPHLYVVIFHLLMCPIYVLSLVQYDK